jgi:hypothetical protein
MKGDRRPVACRIRACPFAAPRARTIQKASNLKNDGAMVGDFRLIDHIKADNLSLAINEQIIGKPAGFLVLRVSRPFEPSAGYKFSQPGLLQERQRFAVGLDVEIAAEDDEIIGLGNLTGHREKPLRLNQAFGRVHLSVQIAKPVHLGDADRPVPLVVIEAQSMGAA